VLAWAPESDDDDEEDDEDELPLVPEGPAFKLGLLLIPVTAFSDCARATPTSDRKLIRRISFFTFFSFPAERSSASNILYQYIFAKNGTEVLLGTHFRGFWNATPEVSGL
jgi:hypothetical protein